jgi:tetratricopeptide (TPR) repeat protein
MRLFKPGSVAVAIAAALVVGLSWFSLANRPVDIEPRLAVARQARQTAESLLQSRHLDDAEQTCRRALAAMDELAVHGSRDVRYRRERALVLDTLGLILVERQLPAEAIPFYNDAINVRAKLVSDLPSVAIDRAPLALGLGQIGQLYWNAGRWDEAEIALLRGVRLCESAFARTDADSRLARERIEFLDGLGRLYADTGRPSESMVYFKKAVAAQKSSTGISASAAGDRERLVTLLIRLATADRQQYAAEQTLAEALDVAARLRVDFPSNDHYNGLVAMVLDQFVELKRSDPPRRSEVRDLLGRVAAIRENLVVESPHSPEELTNLAATYDSLAGLCRDWKSLDEAEAVYRKELACRARLAIEHPAVANYRFGHGRLLHNLADLLRERSRPEEALVLERQAVELLRSLYHENLKDPGRRRAFSYACWALCELLLETKDPRGAASAVSEYLAVEPSGYEEALESARFLCRALVLARDDKSIPAAERAGLARSYAERAMNALQIAFRNGYRDGADLKNALTYEPLRGRSDFQFLLHELDSRNEFPTKLPGKM